MVALPLWLLPWDAAAALGRAYGLVAWAFWPRARRIGAINLRRAYGPEMTRERADRLVKDVLRNLGGSVAEGIQFAHRFKDGDPAWQALCEAEDPALVARLLADPRPKVFVTGHLGSWEAAIMMAAHRVGARGAVIARRVDNPFLNAVVRRVRTSRADQWIEKQGAISAAIRRLRGGESVALLLDENGGYRGIFVDYFGRPASTRKTAALLSVMTGAPLVVGAAVRREGGKLLFRLAHFEPPARRQATPADVNDLTRRLVATYEAWVREAPEQWRWIHARWKTRPDGREETYARSDLSAAFQEAA